MRNRDEPIVGPAAATLPQSDEFTNFFTRNGLRSGGLGTARRPNRSIITLNSAVRDLSSRPPKI
jgi:hypothetical protein